MKKRPATLSAYRLKRQILGAAMPAAILFGAVVAGTVIGFGSARFHYLIAPSYGEYVIGCSVTDGDTIRCEGERIRLLGIDAPELPDHCREGRSLREAMSGTMRISRVGEDRYGRTLAIVESDYGDLSCWQLARRQAVYKSKWDNGARVLRRCPGKIWG
jgi:micrococcal nuclease